MICLSLETCRSPSHGIKMISWSIRCATMRHPIFCGGDYRVWRVVMATDMPKHDPESSAGQAGEQAHHTPDDHRTTIATCS